MIGIKGVQCLVPDLISRVRMSQRRSNLAGCEY